MGNALDYLKWRGDLSFERDAFNEVDNLLLAELSYVDLQGIVPGIEEDRDITIRSAAAGFFACHTEEELRGDKSLIRDCPRVLMELGKSQRFAQCRLSNYVCIVDEKLQKQFSALHIALEDGTVYLAFRGTDDYLVGWREDFNMSFMTVPSQMEALDYVRNTVKSLYRKIRLGGHSKGGNLALYAAFNSPYNIQRKIINVYCNDGPGFMSSLAETRGYQEMMERTSIFVPQGSVVGMLFEHGEKYTIVKSSNRGLMEHDGLSWKVEQNHFLYARDLKPASRQLEQEMKQWLSTLDNSQRREFVARFFQILEATGANTLSELQNSWLKNQMAILKGFTGTDKKTKEMTFQMFRIFMKCL